MWKERKFKTDNTKMGFWFSSGWSTCKSNDLRSKKKEISIVNQSVVIKDQTINWLHMFFLCPNSLSVVCMKRKQIKRTKRAVFAPCKHHKSFQNNKRTFYERLRFWTLSCPSASKPKSKAHNRLRTSFNQRKKRKNAHTQTHISMKRDWIAENWQNILWTK